MKQKKMKIPFELLRYISSFFEDWRILDISLFMKNKILPTYRFLSLKKIHSIPLFDEHILILKINETKNYQFWVNWFAKGICLRQLLPGCFEYTNVNCWRQILYFCQL
jgi:hypothetical protein